MINIYIYQDKPSPSLDIERVILFLYSLNFHAKIRDSLPEGKSNVQERDNALQEYLNSIKIYDIESPLDVRIAAGSEVTTNGKPDVIRDNFFDGYWLQRKLYSFLSSCYPAEINDNCLHIVLTGRLFGTFGTSRYHARVLLTGEPCLLSTSGMVEAPARPKEYYFARAKFLSEGRNITGLDEIFKESFVEYDSPKITDITCSYILQLIKYRYTGDPFCSSDKCCLYNSHWQEEVLNLQYKKEMCEDCRNLICFGQKINKKN